MPRRPRVDKPGRLHHVINRGQDRQRIFRGRKDYRFFLALLACVRRAGKIRLHAYCLMPNHFHLLVESLDGDISATMQWVQFRYAAYFNRTSGHTGHVFGGRFRSFPVTSLVYLFVLIRYIDRNPLKRKRAEDRRDPLAFPWCSAFHHAQPGPRPRWLDRRIVDRFLGPRLERGGGRETAYRQAFGIGRPDPAGDGLVEQRMAGRSRGLDELDTLVLSSVAEVAAWLRARAGADDGPTEPLALVDAGSVLRAVAQLRREIVPFRLSTRRGATRDPRPLVEIGMLRDLVGVTYEVAVELLGGARSQLRRRYAQHQEALVEDDRYLALVAHTVRSALALAFGAEARAVARWARPAPEEGIGDPGLG